jgi:tetratricopeptide (TPR) repeat protein
LIRDTQPSNILITKDGGRDCLKLLDFGLALGRSDRQRMRAEVAGTLGYIAPEILFGGSPSESSDLYSVGVIAYEVLTEQSPHETLDDERLIHRLLDPSCQPDFAPLLRLGPMGAVVQRLMAYSEAARFPTAAAALSALGEATSVQWKAESAEVRESYLQAAPLTGREQEWLVLEGYVDKLMNGSGASLLIAGESGVGKSRLLQELRTYALVRGARVVHGQSVSGSGGAYHVFHKAIRLLCLSVPLTDVQASILKTLAPDLPKLLERPIPDATPIEAQAAQSRLHNTLESLLGEVKVPLALILEDLQWADTESLELLRRILHIVKLGPLLIVGTFRDDERPHLPTELSGTAVLRLKRLPSQQIADLCYGMLGTMPRPELLDFLVKETEGNAFFVVEVMRALAEEAGSLGSVSQHALPPQVVTGGIRSILQRRLDRVAPQARTTLRKMAVAGRHLDLILLRHFEPHVEQWLSGCAEAAVLDVHEQRWRFAHDKLREALVEEVSVEDRKRLHLSVARAMEQLYPDPAAQATSLAYHYREAGMDAEAVHYGVLAGEQALAQGALKEAAALLRPLIAVIDRLPNPSLLLWSRAHRLLGQALFGLYETKECVAVCEKTLQRLQPTSWGQTDSLRKTLSLLRLVGEHALHQVAPSSVRIEKASDARALLQEQLLTLLACGETYAYLGRPADLLRAIISCNEVARTIEDLPQQAFTTAVAAFLLEFSPLRALSEAYLQQAQRLVKQAAHPLAEAQVCRIGGVATMNHGHVAEGAAMLMRAAELFQALGNDFMLLFSLGQAAFGHLMLGQTAEADRIHKEIATIALRGRHRHSYVYHRAVAGFYSARRGHHEQIRTELLEMYTGKERHTDPLVSASMNAALVNACLRMDDLPEALRFAHETMSALPENPTGFIFFMALSAALDAYLTVWESRPALLDRHATERLHHGLSLLRRYSAAMLLARPQSQLLESRVAALRGQLPLAQSKAESALSLAKKYRIPYETALAHEQLGRLASRSGVRSASGGSVSEEHSAAATNHLLAAMTQLQNFGDHWRADKIKQSL